MQTRAARISRLRLRNGIGAALRKVAPSRVEEFARPLITSADPRQQRLGIKLLGETSCPSLLDEFWRIHLDGQKEPSKFDDEKVESWQLYHETFDVLKSAVQENPEWLTTTIARANESERVEDLAWLVANLEDRGAVWRKTKKDLFAKISADKPRSLLACIGRHRDKDELGWVKNWVREDAELSVGPLALQTLSRLDPDTAVSSLPDSDPDDLAMSRRWAFAEVFARRPAGAHAVLLEWMRRHHDPWKVGLLFQENENDLTADELRFLLDALEKTLAQEIASDKCGQHGLHREFEMLSDIAAPHLLDVLHERAGTNFETNLRDYLLRIGSRRGICMDSAVRDPAIGVLNLLGGSGLAEVVNGFLENSDQYGREDAIGWSAKRPNDTTLHLLKGIVLSDEQWGGDTPNPHPISQNSAMKVLAGFGHWETVAEGLKKWGMKTSPKLESPSEPVTASWMKTLRTDAERTPTPGNMLAIGTVGDAADCAAVHKVLDSCDANSELAHACIIALENLGDRSDDGVQRVAPHLEIERHHYSATRMLSAAASPFAWQALFEDIKRKFEFITALNLINLSVHADEVTQLVLDRWSSYRGSDQIAMLRLLIKRIRKEPLRNRILGDPGVRDFIHQLSTAAEGSFWFTGSKAAMIECLALFNPAAAFAACCRCIEDMDLHDRELYPSLLMEIDSRKAADWLITHCANEKSANVRYAIGRVLEERDLSEQLLSSLKSKDSAVREAACFLAGWMQTDERIDRALVDQLDDSSVDVVAAALTTRRLRGDRAIAKELLQRIESEQDAQRKSVWLDAFIGIADPGGEQEQLSPLLVRALQAVGESEAEAGLERVKKRRKKLAENLKKAKRR